MTKAGAYYYRNCSDIQSLFPTLSVQLDEILYTIPAEFYITKEQHLCFSKIGVTQDSFWVLGVVFMQGFYQAYDMERNQVGLQPYVSSMFQYV